MQQPNMKMKDRDNPLLWRHVNPFGLMMDYG